MTNISDPIVLRTPVAVIPAAQPNGVHHFDKITRVFSWMTAAFLSLAIVVALISGAVERNDLRNQISKQSTELICRAEASVDVAKASAARDSTIGRLVIAVSKSNQAEITRLTNLLGVESDAVDQAIAAQETALNACTTR